MCTNEKDFDRIIENFRDLCRWVKVDLITYFKDQLMFFGEKTLLPILIEAAKREIQTEESLRQWRMDRLKEVFPHKSKKFLESFYRENGFDNHKVFQKWLAKQEKK